MYLDSVSIIASNHKALKKIIVDQLPFYNDVKTFERENIIEDISILSCFDCRDKALQRPKEA
jgi:hypothetical protein